MAEINEFIDPRAEKQIQEYLASLTKIADQYKVIFQAATQLDTAITKVSKSTSETTKKQSEADKAATEATRIANQQKAAMEALDRQRQKALQDIAKQEAKEKDLQRAISMQVKTLKDAENQNRALNEAKKRVDITTKQGVQTVAAYNKKIDENNRLIKQNASEEGKRKLGIGQYKEAMLKVIAVVGLAIGAFNKLFGGISESLNLFDVQARGIAQVNAVLKSTNGVSGQNVEALKKQASELQKVTRIGDEMTLSAQAMLLTFTNVRGEVYEKSIPLIQDMATAMAMSTGTTIDLKAASIQMGKALNDPIKGITALSRVGVAFTEVQKKQITTMVEAGDVAGAQAIILNELQTEFGGSARAAALAGTGGLVQLKNMWNDLKEVAGGAMVQILNPLISYGKQIISTITPVERLSEGMEVQKAKVNALVIALSDANTKEATRKVLYEELKTLAPEVVKGINAENISVITLNKNLAEYNKQQLNKILLQRGQDDINEQLNDEADAFESLTKRSEQLGAGINKVFGDLAAAGGKSKDFAVNFKAMFLAGKISNRRICKGIGRVC